MRATAIIQAAVAAAAGGDVPPDNTVENGYTETYLVDAQATSQAAGVTQGLATASGWKLLDGSTFADSSTALGTITYEGNGSFSCPVVGSVPTDPDTMSWVTFPLQRPDGTDVTAEEFFGIVQQLPETLPADVQVYVGFASRADLAAAEYALLFGMDDSDGSSIRPSLRRKEAGTWQSEIRPAGVEGAGTAGIRCTWGWEVTGAGLQRLMGLGRPLLSSGQPGNNNNRDAVDTSPTNYILSDPSCDLHWVVGFSVRATVGAAAATEVQFKQSVTAPPAADGLAVAPAVYGVLTGQSVALGGVNATGDWTGDIFGEYRQGTTLLTEYPVGDDHSFAPGLLEDHGGSIRRGIIEVGAAGTDLEGIIARTPGYISSIQAAGIAPAFVCMLHGEADSQDPTKIAAYQGRLTTWAALWTAAFPGIEFYMNEIQVDLSGYDADGLNAEIVAWAGARGDAVVVIDDGDLTLADDDLHPNSAGSVLGGQMVAAQAVTDGIWDTA